jgi:hypothetical protein
VEGDLRIGRPVIRGGGRDGLRGAETIDFHNTGHDRALCRLPDERRAKPAGHQQATEGHQAPVPRLDAGRANALVPELGRVLVGVIGSGVLP